MISLKFVERKLIISCLKIISTDSISDFLQGNASLEKHSEVILKDADVYKFFNLLLIDYHAAIPSIIILNNVEKRIINMSTNVDCLGNVPQTIPNPRTIYGLPKFRKVLEKFQASSFSTVEERDSCLEDLLYDMLKDTTEIDGEFDGTYKHIFNQDFKYLPDQDAGTVSSTIFFVDSGNSCTFIEVSNFKQEDKVRKFHWTVN